MSIKTNTKHDRRFFIGVIFAFLATGCTVQQGVLQKELNTVLSDDLDKAIVGISIYDQGQDRFLYEQNEYVRLTPASNTKLLTAYASLKYLPDSLPGWYVHETRDTLYIKPNADGTFLNRNFKEQRFYEKLAATDKPIVLHMPAVTRFGRLGSGWSWNSYQASYVRERSFMPIYGNHIRFRKDGGTIRTEPSYFERYLPEDYQTESGSNYSISRNFHNNHFTVSPARELTTQRPFTNWEDEYVAYHLLQDTLKDKTIILHTEALAVPYKPFYTHKTDDILEVMMHNSDNFLAEQLLLMVSNELLDGQISDQATIRKVIHDNFQDFDVPIWSDGSGLSRSNNMSPRFFISLLRQMQEEFSADRLRKILPQGNEGTLRGYYIGNENHIYAKTGTLSGVIALSGYVDTKKGNSLLFSFIVNSNRGNAADTRQSIEKVITRLIDHY